MAAVRGAEMLGELRVHGTELESLAVEAGSLQVRVIL